MKRTILFVNTTESKRFFLGLIKNEKWLEKRIFKRQSDQLLLEIHRLLKKNNLSPKDLSAIAICLGPGSFTGIRIGLTVVNILGRYLKIPLIGLKGEISARRVKRLFKQKKFFKFLKPYYGRQPNITRQRS